MRILYTSDIHAGSGHLTSMLSVAARERVDGVVIGGDLVPHGLPGIRRMGVLKVQDRYLRDTFIPAIREFKGENEGAIYLDMGNDDFIAGRRLLETYDGELFHLLHMRKHTLAEGVDIIGYMAVPPTPFHIKDWEKPDTASQPYLQGGVVSLEGYVSDMGVLREIRLDLDTDDTMERDLSELSGDISGPFIFVSHCPPYGTPLDMLFSGQHVGSVSVREFVETWSDRGFLLASFHGHIHESPEVSGSIRTTIGSSVCINPGQGTGAGAAFRYVIFEVMGEAGIPRIEVV